MINPSPTIEERTWAVISHLSALAFGMGLALTILGWSEQRRKSKYASFQCLQALGYQSLGYTVWLLSYLVVAVLFLVLLLIESFLTQKSGTPNSTMTGVEAGLFLFFFFGLLALYLLLPIMAAIACAFGRDFRYPVLGKRLVRYLEDGLSHQNAAFWNGEHEERWVASMGHFSVIIFLWGLLAPALTWILQGRYSPFLKFQSIQTTIYQALVNLLYLGATMLSFVGMIPLFLWAALDGNSGNHPATSLLGPVLLLIPLLFLLLFLLVIPLFHILGQWAGYRVLKGDDYRYPILGRMVEKRLTKSNGVQESVPASSGEPLDSKMESS
jgi:uncharacterized Tic20 family protein